MTHYGIQIIVDGTGEFQYSTQFGISNPSYNSATTHSTTTDHQTTISTRQHTATATGYAPLTTSSAVISQISDGQLHGHTGNATTSSAATPVVIVSTLNMNATHLTTPAIPHLIIASTGAPHHNSTHLKGTKTMTVPKTLQSHSARKTTKTSHVIASATAVATPPTSTSATSSSQATAPSSGAAHLGIAGSTIAALAVVMALMLYM